MRVVSPAVQSCQRRDLPEKSRLVVDDAGAPTWEPPQGLWTSTYINRDVVSHWFGFAPFWNAPSHIWLLSPRQDARVLSLAGLEDVRRAEVLYGSPGFGISAAILMRAGFDGLHVQRRLVDEAERKGHPLASWSSESTVWFKWAFERVYCIGHVMGAMDQYRHDLKGCSQQSVEQKLLGVA